MATETYSTLIAKYPEFTTTVTAELTRIDTAIDTAEMAVGAGVLKTSARTSLVRLTLAAHFVRMMERTVKHGGAGGGAIPGRTFEAGDSVSYTLPSLSMSEGALLTTSYGVIVIQMLRGAQHRRPVVSG